MLTFDAIPIGPTTYTPQELTINDCLKVAVVSQQLNEKRVTVFLKGMLQDDKLPLSITCQERYYLLMKYVEKQGNSLLAIDMDLSACYLPPGMEWKTQITQNGVTVQQLNGRGAEFLESKCKNAIEWLACMMALQLAHEKHPELAVLPDLTVDDAAFEQQFMQRLDYIKKLSQSEFELCYEDFAPLNQQLFSLISLTANNSGLVIERGADDAPVRFRPSAAFIRLIKELDQSFN
ncbi:hypothetical protein [Alkanindiges illinoisensis]|uniref:hypothetical protein n=1 Tax=Alkanindiges illinoisensis TaxID=197183 RepID=UPI00047AF7FC|nr:hypothetical protein [Alkanindiges illinoisensis]